VRSGGHLESPVARVELRPASVGAAPKDVIGEGEPFNFAGPPPLNGHRAPTEERIVFISNAYAQATAAAQSTEQSLLGMLPLVLMFVVLYFVMIRPQMKRQKEHKAMIEAVAKGDEIVTAGGVIGKITKLGDSIVNLEVANGIELQIQRSAITQVLPKGSVSSSK
jgi:preprotein translocase subunit YajC